MYDMFLNAVKLRFDLHCDGLLIGDSAIVNTIWVNAYVIDLITDWVTSLFQISNSFGIYSKYMFYDLTATKYNLREQQLFIWSFFLWISNYIFSG